MPRPKFDSDRNDVDAVIDEAMANVDPATVALTDPEIALHRVRGGVSEYEREALERRAREALAWIDRERHLLATGGIVVGPRSALASMRKCHDRNAAAWHAVLEACEAVQEAR